MEENTDVAEVFEMYNREIDKLGRQVESLRSDLINAETAKGQFKAAEQREDLREAAYKKSTDNLKKVIRRLGKELTASERENEVLTQSVILPFFGLPSTSFFRTTTLI